MEVMQSQKLAASVKTLSCVTVKEIINCVALDTKERAGFYRAILSLLSDGSQPVIEDEYTRLENMIRSHIQTEAKMLQAAEELLGAIDDARVKRILSEIHQDEVRHNKLMQKLLQCVVKRTLREDEIWDMLWRDEPGHGVPIA